MWLRLLHRKVNRDQTLPAKLNANTFIVVRIKTEKVARNIFSYRYSIAAMLDMEYGRLPEKLLVARFLHHH